nr:MFS transporter [Mesobacillus boroniphilus]
MIFCLGLGVHLILYNLFLYSIVNDEIAIGKIIGLNFMAQALVYIPAGLFSDRAGSKKGVIAGVSIFSFALIGNLFVSDAAALSFWGFVLGLGHAASIVTFVPLLTEYSTSVEKKDLFTFAFSTGTFFTFIGTLLGGIISDSIQEIFQVSQTSSIRITLSIPTILLILSLVPLLSLKEHRKVKIKRTSPFSIVKNKPKSLMPIINFSLSKILGGVSLGILAPFINLFFLHKFSLSPSNISFILAGGTLATVFFMSYNSKITDRFSDVKTVSLYHLLSIPAVLLLGITQNIWIAIIAFAIFRSAKFSLTPIESKIMMERVEPEVRGLANSFGFMANSICISLLGPFAMYIVQVAGNQTGYLVLCGLSSIGSLLAAIYFWFAFGTRKEVFNKKLENNPA